MRPERAENAASGKEQERQMEGGNRPGQNTGSERPIRDWQKDTVWYGPAPMNENPFDEPEDAPELREMRSESLNDHSGDFWRQADDAQVTGGYRFGAQPRQAEQPKAEKKEPEERHPVRMALTVLTAAGILFCTMYFGVFSVRNIQVTGNEQIPASEIIRLSGIRTGTPILAVSSEEVEARITRNPLIRFRYLEKQMPGTVILSVRERESCCWMIWNGILYVMDKQRMVLFESEDLRVQPAALVRVNGLRIRSGAAVGETLTLEDEEQKQAFYSLFLEMKVLGCTEMIESAEMSNTNSLLLTTRDGFTVSLGNASNIHAKLRAMLLTRLELLNRDYEGGIINVTLPETPIYSPPTV